MLRILTSLAERLDLPANLVFAGAIVVAGLAVGSLVRWTQLRGVAASVRRERLGSLLVWWVMAGIVSIILITGRVGGAVVFAAVSVVSLTEYFRLLDAKSIDRAGRGVLFAGVALVYGFLAFSPGELWVSVLIMVTAIATTTALVLAHRTAGYLASVTSLVWGTLICVFGLAHAPMLLTLARETNPAGGNGGLFLYLMVLTQCDDIFQALWGRWLGRRKIAPVVSPNKTVEGFLLGGLSTIVLGVILAPFVTPFAEAWNITVAGSSIRVPYLGAVLAGILVCLAGFFGDLNISALKRDAGVKDCGNILPGQGGILDRVDSLTFTAPVFYYFIRLCYA